MPYPRLRTILVAATAVASLWLVPVAGAQNADPNVVARVVALRGAVVATAPGQGPRTLRCNDPIYRGDRVTTAANSQLGALSGEFYAGVNQATRVGFDATDAGAPDLSLSEGHIRVVDAAAAAPARVQTPDLVAPQAGTDTEAFAFAEKAGAVSMVCTWNDPVAVLRPGGQPKQASAGQCAVSKPAESLYTADASHDRLAMLDDAACAPRIAAVAGPRFAGPLPAVGLGPPGSADPGIRSLAGSIPLACDLSAQGCGGLRIQAAGAAIVIPPIVPVGPPPGGMP